ncbi:GNAT family N-acetyltransferase [Myxococcota bacterium]|nr:GNAT family N-acetyltransferase [Myxococcota bacterium]
MTDLHFATVTPESIPASVALAHEVGWPDTESDWRVMHASAHVIGASGGGTLVGQGALGLYGASGTIAKMIVRPSYQRMGLGGQILEMLLAEFEKRSMSSLGLVATAFGRPSYERAGFVAVGDVVGLAGVAEVPSIDEAKSLVDGAAALDEMIRVDSSRLGCSRSRMLQARYSEAIGCAGVGQPGGGLCGYAMACAQVGHVVIGPVVAETVAQARVLVRSILRRIHGTVRIDVPGEQVDFLDWLFEIGLVEQKRRPEMARGCARLPWQMPTRFALAAQAWG